MNQVQNQNKLWIFSNDSNSLIPDNLLKGLILIACVLRFLNPHFQSPWLDEISTLYDADPNLTISELFYNIIYSQVHPPLYFVVSHYFMRCFGFNIETLRFLSAIFGILSIYMFYKLGKVAFSEKVGLVSALLLAINTGYFGLSLEARSYTLLILLLISSTYFFVKLIKVFEYKNLGYLTIINIFTSYTSYFGTIFIVSQSLFILYYLWNKEYKLFFLFTLSYFIVLVFFLPWMPNIFQGFKFADSWIKKPTLELLRPAMNSVFPNFYVKILIVLFFITGLITGVIYRIKETAAIILSFVFLIIISYAFSYIFTPILSWKYFIFAVPGLLMIVSLGFVNCKIGHIPDILFIIFLILSIKLTFVDYSINYKIAKAEFRTQIDLVGKADFSIPAVINEAKALKELSSLENIDFEVIKSTHVVADGFDYRNKLQNGWWELRLHRPFKLSNVYGDSIFSSNFLFFDYKKFSSFRLAIPKSRILHPSSISHQADTNYYFFQKSGNSSCKVLLTDTSNFNHYSNEAFVIQSSIDKRKIRFSYKKGCNISRININPDGDIIKIFPIISTHNFRSGGGIEKLMFINND